MKRPYFPRIVQLVPLSNARLVAEFDDGRVVLADLRPLVERGNLFARLADDSYHRKARIIENGRAVAWPKGLDFCADALYLKGAVRRSSNPHKSAIGATIFAPAAEVAAA